MKSMLRFLAVSAVMALLAVPMAFAQTPEMSTLPVDTPVDAGGTILQPGIYSVRLLPTFADRNRVQITSPDGSKIFATLLTVPHRLAPGEEVPNSTFVFYPAADGAPRALRTWYAPTASALGGHDIVYEESRARQLARLAKSPVVSYTGTEVADLGNTELHVITPEETVQPYVVTAPPMTSQSTVDTTTTTTTTTTAMPAPAPAPVQVAEAEPMKMPRTAGDVPLMALLGLAAVGGALALRTLRQA